MKPLRCLALLTWVVASCESEDTPAPDARPATDAAGDAAGEVAAEVLPVPIPVTDAKADLPSLPDSGAGGATTPPVTGTGGRSGGGALDAQPFDAGVVFEVGSPGTPPPPIGPGAVKLLPAGSEILGGITVGCSYATTSTVRWCAFARRGATLGKLELWVVNMSKVPGVSCTTSNADCLLVHNNLYNAQPQSGPRHPTAHRWYGDTFVFHANPRSTASQVYAGPVYAWQPGWAEPKQISGTENAFRCVGHSQKPLALCIENLSSPDVQPLTFDLYAGNFDGVNKVAKIARISPSHPTAMTSQWGAGFTADGSHFVYSTGIPPAVGVGEQQPETLFYIETAKIGTSNPVQVGEPGISSWDVSPDNKKWFYLRDYNYSDTTPSGTLYMADFPTGANPVRLASDLIASGNRAGVSAYDLVLDKDRSLAWIALIQGYDGTTGTFRILKNPAGNLTDPTNVVKVVDATLPIMPSNSPDLRYGWYFLNRAMGNTPTTDSRVLKYDGTGTCTLAAAPNATVFGVPFSDSGTLALWTANYNPDSDTGEGWIASPADCMSKKRKFADGIDYWFVKGDSQVIYSDNVNVSRSTLRVAPIVSGDLGPAEIIQTGIERFFGLLPNQEGVVYRIESTSEAANGLYFRKLP